MKCPYEMERLQQDQSEYDSIVNIMPKSHDSDNENQLLVPI